MATAGEVIEEYSALSEGEREKVNAVVRGLPPAPSKYVGPLWVIIVLAFAAVMVGGGYLLFLLIQDGDSTEVLVPIVTAALGVLAGLLAPSPATSK